MANSLASIILLILFCGSAIGTRTKLFSFKGQKGISAVSDDGICKSVVDPQGYVCQEHTVISQIFILLKLQGLLQELLL